MTRGILRAIGRKVWPMGAYSFIHCLVKESKGENELFLLTYSIVVSVVGEFYERKKSSFSPLDSSTKQ